MGPTAACVDTMEMIIKSWISPHSFGVQLTGLLLLVHALGVVGGDVCRVRPCMCASLRPLIYSLKCVLRC